MAYNLPDGVTQADIDRHCQGERCDRPGHSELNMDGTCDQCDDDDAYGEPDPLSEPVLFDPHEFWLTRSEFTTPDVFEIGHIVEGGME